MRFLSTICCLFLVAIKSLPVAAADGDDNKNAVVSFVIHLNGQPDPCGTTRLVTQEQIDKWSSTAQNKYELETILTDGMVSVMNKETSSCHDQDLEEQTNNNNDDDHERSLYTFCDRGPELTPILLDHKQLIKTQRQTLPCRWYTREGLRITSGEQLQGLLETAKNRSSSSTSSCANPQDASDCDTSTQKEGTATTEVHLYAVPAGRVFMFAPAYVGEIFQLDHLKLLPDVNKPIYLQVLSTNPRVFDILNVFTPEEADAVVQRALNETSPTHRIKRSTTGTTENAVFTKRTSENGFDTHGTVALALKQRIFELLGYDEYWDGHDDGLQVLRYNLTQAYIQHDDYLTDPGKKDTFDYESSKKGGNRYATVLLYMTDLPDGAGGETVFSETWPNDVLPHHRTHLKTAVKELRKNGDTQLAGITEGSWEEEMVALCRTRLAIKPHAGRAVLFYSQHPNGEMDRNAKHGGCPVLNGTKWAANLWVWNTPRKGYKGAPIRDDVDPATLSDNGPKQLFATFVNTGKDPTMANAELYYESQKWGPLHPDKPLRANTYEGHRWNVRVGDEVVTSWVIGNEQKQQFVI
ncbi:2(OG)-Fe(II) oxygenase superfamily protein [Nitzschia inconspicua]|uniref:2(OG)-Fe(II) oxygenase superfamily protein n=1 Tax=Nitzschia inconspicua TaxID=303405 RepID=A0A9K3L8F3_9STRA|nr:2(OG)-Fe(II) oxygenase superfamily protein [Nitzschia inconspicua]